MGFGTVVYTTTLYALKTSATLHLPDSFVIKYLSLNRCLNLKNTGLSLPYPCACTTFADMVAGEHAFTRPTTMTDRMPRFTFLTPNSAQIPPQLLSACGPDCHLRNRQTR